MKWLTRWFLDNPVAANLLMLTLFVGGYFSFKQLRIESFPQIAPSSLVVSVSYPGGTAVQVDDGITQRVEEAVSDLAGIKRITSTSSEGSSMVTITKTSSMKLNKLMEEVRNRVSGISDLPSAALTPQVYRNEFTNLAAYVVISGPRNDDELQPIAQAVKKALKKHPKISQVANLGVRQPMLFIEPDVAELRRYGLSLNSIANRIHESSLETQRGELKSERGRLTIRGDGYADTVRALNELVITSGASGEVTLGELSHIYRGYEETGAIVRNNGKTAIALSVSTSQQDNLLEVSDAIAQVLSEQKLALPHDIAIDVIADMAPYIEEQLTRLGTNAWQGLLIVVIILGLFLNYRLAFWVAVGIPISIAGALGMMSIFGYSINDITLFGLILVLGILVDDAVVVGESIHDARGKYQDPKLAAYKGVERVAVATVFGVLTTIAAFSPMLWIDNELAKILAGFSAVVIFALIFSLIESKFILPAHLMHLNNHASSRDAENKASTNPIVSVFKSAQAKANNGLSYVIDNLYQPTLRGALKHKAASLLFFISLLILAYGLWAKGYIKSAMFPEIPGRYMTATIALEDGAPLPLQMQNMSRLEAGAQKASKQLVKQYLLTEQPIVNLLIESGGYGEISATAELSIEALQRINNTQMLKLWQQYTGELEGAYSAKFSAADETAGGTFITLKADDRKLATMAAKSLRQYLSALPGVEDVYDDGQGGMLQLRLKLNDYGRRMGLTQANIAQLAASAYGNLEVHKLLYSGQETKIVLKFKDSERMSLEQLKSAPILLNSGQSVFVSDVAEFNYERVPDEIYRRGREQVISVYWRQDRLVQSPEETLVQLEEKFSEIEAKFPGVKVSAAGEFEEIAEVQSGFKRALILTLLLIYTLLAIPLKSYWQPFIIMSVVPFGFIGALWGHGMMDLPISILSLFGMMAMTGIVVNDSLVLMTRFNEHYRQGMSAFDAAVTAGKSRFRAIFLTTVTTVCGLIPLLLESSEQAQYLKPAAVSLVFGELFATAITLILIPLILVLFNRTQVKGEIQSLDEIESELALEEKSAG